MKRKIGMVVISLLCSVSALFAQNPRTLPADTSPANSDIMTIWKASPVQTKHVTLGTLLTFFQTGVVPTTRTITCTPPLLCDGGSSMNLSANRTLSINTATFAADGSIKRTVYNPRDYGSLGTANDTTVFQAAIDACAATGVGGTVIVPAGNWNVCGVRTKTLCNFVGAGERSSKLTATASCAEVVKLDSPNVQWVTISDLWIEGNKISAPSSIGVIIDNDGMAYTGSGPIFLRNLMITNTGGDGLKLYGTASERIENITVRGAGGHCFSFVQGVGTPYVADMVIMNTNGEGCAGDLVHCEHCVNQNWTGFKGGGVVGTDRGFYFDSLSHNNTIANASVDGLVTTAWYFEGFNNVCMACNAFDAATSTTPAVVFTSTADNNLFTGFVKTQSASPITGYAVDMQSGATGNRVNVVAENMILGGFPLGTDITNNTLVYNAFPYIPATPRVLCRASAGAGPQEICTLGAGLSNSTTTLTTASDETDFLKSGALTCGAGTQGKMQVHTTPVQYCDNAATPTLRYAAYGDSAGKATDLACTTCTDTSDIANAAITYAKVQNVSAGRLLGNSTGGAASIEEISVGSNLTLSSGVLNTAVTIAAGTFSTACTSTGGINVASISQRTGQWSRDGATVTVSAVCDVDPTTAGIRTGFVIPLPVASNLTILGDLGGVACYDTGTTVDCGPCKADTGQDAALCLYMADAGGASQPINIHFTYQIK